MKYTTVSQLYASPDAYFDKQITVCGWVRTIRDSKNFAFVELNDGSHFKSLQIVLESVSLSNYEEIVKQNVGASLVVKGILCATPQAKQPFEVKAGEIYVEGESTPDYPLQKKRHTLDYLRTMTHLRPRTNTMSAVFRVRSKAAYAIHKFFNDNGFSYIHTPIITTSDCEGAGEMFRVTALDFDKIDGKPDFSRDFFQKNTYLTVSGQLNAECFAQAFDKIYTFGPTFRAENSNTARHAAEFWMIEPEIAFSDLNDDMELAEKMIKYVISYLLENCKYELEFFNSFVDKALLERLKNIIENDFGRITYTEAVGILEKVKDKFEYPVSWGIDLQTEHERYLTEQVFKKPVFVIDYPAEIKAFYMRLNDDKKTVAAMDLLVPGVGEIIGGSQREERMDVLLEKMDKLGLDKDNYGFYLDLRKYGGTKHAGFGLGFERLIMYVTGMANIRDVLPFPRTVKNADL